MTTTTMPQSRFGWDGQTLEYVVKATGATELRVPEKTEDGLNVRVLEQHKVGDGVEARVAVDVASPVFY